MIVENSGFGAARRAYVRRSSITTARARSEGGQGRRRCRARLDVSRNSSAPCRRVAPRRGAGLDGDRHPGALQASNASLTRGERPARQRLVRARRDVGGRQCPAALSHAALAVPVTSWSVMLSVALYGDVVNGARRWLNVASPASRPRMMKIAVPLMSSPVYFDRYEARSSPAYLVAAFMLALPSRSCAPARLGNRRTHPGDRLLPIVSAGLCVADQRRHRCRRRREPAVAVVRAARLPATAHPHAARPMQDPLGAGYHTIQSTIAMGAGGLAGKDG